jgi:hypothetical protein
MRFLPHIHSTDHNDAGWVASLTGLILNVATYFPETLEDGDTFIRRVQSEAATHIGNKSEELFLSKDDMLWLVRTLSHSKSAEEIKKDYDNRVFRRYDAACILGMHYTLSRLCLGASLRKCIYLYSKKSGKTEQTGWNIWKQYSCVSHFVLAELCLIGMLENHGIRPGEISADCYGLLSASKVYTALELYDYGTGHIEQRTGRPLLDQNSTWTLPRAYGDGGESLLCPEFFNLREQEREWLDEYSKRNV